MAFSLRHPQAGRRFPVLAMTAALAAVMMLTFAGYQVGEIVRDDGRVQSVPATAHAATLNPAANRAINGPSTATNTLNPAANRAING